MHTHHAGFLAQGVLDQPDTGSAVDPLHQQVDLAQLAHVVNELLLHLVQIEQGNIPRRLRRGREQKALGGTLVKTLHTGGIDSTAHRLATDTAKLTCLASDLAAQDIIFRGKRQTAVKTGLVISRGGLSHGGVHQSRSHKRPAPR